MSILTERGLILTSSIPRCQKILRYLSPKNTKRIRICHSMNKDGKTQDEVISEHATDPTGVLTLIITMGGSRFER